MRDISFGQYYPVNSVIHNIDARIKILVTLLFMVTVFFIVSYTAFAFMFFLLTVSILISQVPYKTVLKSIKGILVLLIFTALLNIFFTSSGNALITTKLLVITDQGINFAIKMALRFTLLVLGSSLLTLTTTPTELTDALEYLLKPLKLIKIPVHDLAIIMSIALRFIPGLVEETDKIMMAQKARGANLDSGNLFKKIKAMLPVLIPLFVSAFRRADELADALDARCYNASPTRTKLKVFKVKAGDIFVFVGFAIVMTAIMLDKYYVGSFVTAPDLNGFDVSGLDIFIYNILYRVGR
ncbi:MAG: energy-coupling factor transporter transmembrane protein EcfT [Clostridiales bacterium]|nr:energy-coupling factor transporter transmembrane protein EcfT [Clostridiales bacterium]MBD5530564.1 energy-coupling factor transporter transmembrane protein EcfT [Lachnospiraceae bacterium]